MNETNWIIADDDSIVLMHNGETYTLSGSHPNFTEIVDALNEEEFDRLDDLINVEQTIVNNFGDSGVTVEDGEVFYNGEVLHNNLTERILTFMRKGLPYQPLLAFLGNLMENPSYRSRNELYDFLAHGGMPITADGCFIGYKAIRENWTDKHTGKCDNSVGAINEMPRSMVDDDCQNACSVGYHVGAFNYANKFGSCNDRMVLVKVNPRDAVSVPYDHDNEKLRVCRYEVVEEHASKTVLTDDLFGGMPAPAPTAVAVDDDDDWVDYEPNDDWF